MELIIHILEAVIVACMAFVMVIAVLITRDLSKIIERIEDRESKERATRQKMAEAEIEKSKLTQNLFKVYLKNREGKAEINVVDKPLDFPNDH